MTRLGLFSGVRVGSFCALALLGATACSMEEDEPPPVGVPGGDEQAELQAILHDGDLARLGAAAEGALHLAAARPQVATPDGGAPPPTFRLPFGAWNFDDCTSFRTQLFDQSFNGNTAFRSVAVTCATGNSGQGVNIAAPEDIVYVPDQPNFTFEQGVTVAGWFKPSAVGGTKTLIRKRDKGTSSFALVLNQGKFQFVVSLGNGVAVSVTAPTKAKVNQFTHVAGTYDGQVLRLYVGGVQVTSFAIAGSIPAGPGPLLIGNDGSERRTNGIIDDIVFEGRALSASDVLELTCTRNFPTVTVDPRFPTTPAGTPVAIDVAITNTNGAACAPLTFEMQSFASFGLTVDPQFAFSDPVPSGGTGHFILNATSTPDVESGFFFINIFLRATDPRQNFFTNEFAQVEVTEVVGACTVRKPRELMITDPSVVDDPRTVGDGVWSFKHLMENLSPTPEDAPAVVEQMLRSFTTDSTLNGFTLGTRIGVQLRVLNQWPVDGNGVLDLAQAPLRLQAIVHRFDLRDLAAGNAGEGRFVFAFEQNGFPLQATLIVEYKLPAASEEDVLQWANDIHALGALPFGDEYNAALAALTERFAGRGVRPGSVNGSALNALRTNEIDLGGGLPWELREFHLDPGDGFLRPSPIDRTPDRAFDNTETLAAFINENAAAIIAEQHTVPLEFAGAPFQGAAILNDPDTWFAPGVDPEARHKFALNTCNGCHSTQETNTFFLQITPRFGAGSQASLSPFLTGTSVFDPVAGQTRTFNDLERRATDLEAIVCAAPGAKPSGVSLTKGISRVH